jgi:hypothetical protein
MKKYYLFVCNENGTTKPVLYFEPGSNYVNKRAELKVLGIQKINPQTGSIQD